MTKQEIVEQLEQLQANLMSRVDERVNSVANPNEIKSMRKDLDTTIKAFDLLQTRIKTTAPAQTQDTRDLKAHVARALESNTDKIQRFITGDKTTPLNIEVKDMTLGGNYSGGTAALNMAPTGIVNSINRWVHIRDLVPVVTMDKGSLPVIKDNGKTGDFGFVSEGDLKPALDFNLAESPAKAEVLAAITVVSRQFLDDLGASGVSDWIVSKLTELYLNKEDDALLNGTGVSPQIGGMNLAGNFTAATAPASDNDVVQLVKALIQMRTLERNPQAIVINPADLSRVLLNMASGSGEFDLPSYISVNANGGLSILNVPIIDTVGQTAGRFNVIDSAGMVMGIRENLNIRFFEQDSDNVRRNKITIRAEARVAFANYSPANVIQGTFES